MLADCESPRLPQVAATYEMPDCFVAVYDYIPGDTLEHIVAARGRLTVAEAVQIVQDICEALADLHAHGVIHCDVNPSNVIVAADGRT
ncbi:MAG: protein kinase [Slackia piriformis]|uniref:Protein kinase n=1 Tax=Slackia piriformis TaxID=626934 RepID=A0A943YYY4_9ACTN|nr:protein kinase [Slackia piriformis]